MKKRKDRISTIILGVVFLAGLSLLLYPSVSNYVNEKHQTKTISDYSRKVDSLDDEEYEALWEEAKEYNEKLSDYHDTHLLSNARREEYESLLNINGDGVMGYIIIPSINVTLPIYHGTDEAVLQVAVGHLDWSSLPVGGSGSHCVLSGHRGLPSAKLFTNLNKLVEGDVFMMRVLDEILTYEVDQILIVEPGDTEALNLEKNQDYCTLVTCTPYGINSHRLLVRGRRIENAESTVIARVTADAIQIEPLIVASIVAIPLLCVLILAVVLQSRRKGNKTGKRKQPEVVIKVKQKIKEKLQRRNLR